MVGCLIPLFAKRASKREGDEGDDEPRGSLALSRTSRASLVSAIGSASRIGRSSGSIGSGGPIALGVFHEGHLLGRGRLCACWPPWRVPPRASSPWPAST